jgi:hypothetical protein
MKEIEARIEEIHIEIDDISNVFAGLIDRLAETASELRDTARGLRRRLPAVSRR